MSDDFNTDINIRQIQLRILDIGKEVKRICEKNNIKYFLDGGTLLGAVRHQGFIPWDDDMDIGMTRTEYNKFCEAVKYDIGDEFLFQSWDEEENYGQPFGKMMLKNTVWVEQATRKVDINHLLYVDIFVFDGVCEQLNIRKKIYQKFHYYHILYLFKCGYDLLFFRKGINKTCFYILKCVSSFYSKDYLERKCKEILDAAPKDSELYFDYGAPVKLERGIRNRKWLEELVPYKFEDTEFLGPKNYDVWLTKAYGNYMELPPIEQRTSHHDIIEIEV